MNGLTGKEEQSMVARYMAIDYENDSEQTDRLCSELDQMKSTITKKDEQTKKLQKEGDDILMEYEVRPLLLFAAQTLNYHSCSNWLYFYCETQKCKSRVVTKVWEPNAHRKGGREVRPMWVHTMLM